MFWMRLPRRSASAASRAPVHISHFKSMQIPNWGRVRDAAGMIEKARAGGMKITADQYPYTANSFSLADATLPAPKSSGASDRSWASEWQAIPSSRPWFAG